MELINPRTKAVSLAPFKWHGATLRVTGTRRAGAKWMHTVKNEDTGEFKEKEHSWIEQVNRKLNESTKSI